MPAVDPSPKIFQCNVCGWILGESYREPGKRITQLRIFRHPQAQVEPALIARPALPSRPAVMFVAMQVNDCAVLCEHCGAETSWFANQNAIEMMIERKNIRKVVLDEKKEVPP